MMLLFAASRPPPRSTLFPYTTLFRSLRRANRNLPWKRPAMLAADQWGPFATGLDRKRTRLNSSHGSISYAVHCGNTKRETLALLRQSERDPGALPQALAAFDRLPALS